MYTYIYKKIQNIEVEKNPCRCHPWPLNSNLAVADLTKKKTEKNTYMYKLK